MEDTSGEDSSELARVILNNRYAKGKITIVEYEGMESNLVSYLLTATK